MLPNETADELSWLKYLQKELMRNLLMKRVSHQKVPVHQNLGFRDVCLSPGKEGASGHGWVSWSKPKRLEDHHLNKISEVGLKGGMEQPKLTRGLVHVLLPELLGYFHWIKQGQMKISPGLD